VAQLPVVGYWKLHLYWQPLAMGSLKLAAAVQFMARGPGPGPGPGNTPPHTRRTIELVWQLEKAASDLDTSYKLQEVTRSLRLHLHCVTVLHIDYGIIIALANTIHQLYIHGKIHM